MIAKAMIYGELGRFPIEIYIKINVLGIVIWSD
jgi:hypothetical protein